MFNETRCFERLIIVGVRCLSVLKKRNITVMGIILRAANVNIKFPAVTAPCI